jgi:hypothetical protein
LNTTAALWLQPLPPLCGYNHYRRSAATTITAALWLQPLAPLCGYKHWRHSVATIITTTLWLQKKTMQTPKIITLTREDIATEHICCGFADKKCDEG